MWAAGRCVRALDIGQQFVSHHEHRSDEFMNRIITMYESLVHHFKPENKIQSVELCRKRQLALKKVKTTVFVGKVMFTVL